MSSDNYEKLKALRTRKDLTLRACPNLKDTCTGFDGKEQPLTLRYYQIQGILHLIAVKRFLLGDDTGLGKTLQAIAALCYLWEKNPDQKVIVLTNKSAVSQWAGEYKKFTKGVRVVMCKGSPTQRRKARDEYEASTGPTVLIMGYRSAVQDIRHIQPWEGHIVIFDEATAFKNPKTQVHQVCRHLANRAERVWALTATLIKNSLTEGWGIYQVVCPGIFPTSLNGFMNHYCVTRMQRLPGGRRMVPVIVGYRKDQIVAFRDKIDPLFLGRPKMEVAKELPPLTTRRLAAPMNTAQAAKYAEALSGLLEVLDRDSGDYEEKEVTKLTAIAYCQQIVNHPELIGASGGSAKLDTLIDLVVDGDLQGEKVIVFSRFRRMVDIIMRELAKSKIRAVRITGSENEDQRAEAQKVFQNSDSDTQVICITTAGADAINLQAAKAIVFYDTPWSGGDYIQAIGRMIRIGTLHDSVYAFHIVAPDTIDDRVMEVMTKKLKLIESIIGKRIKGEGDEMVVAAENDISDLFEALQADARDRFINV
jgi:SNF2 family DNA or RNA helicase